MTKVMRSLCVIAAAGALVACGGEDEAAPNPIEEQGALEIEGTWSSNFGGTEIIGADTWASVFTDEDGVEFTSETSIEEYSNAENEIVTQNPDDDAFNPSRFNRIVWTEIDGDSFYYCITDFGLESAADASARNTPADDSDPDEGGCGTGENSFPWTKLTRE
ncbi:MAG TPA: hypothetical protein VGK73_37425 [Polyangiaceae bacterium]